MSVAQASVEMPKYQCHKQVWALKIRSIQQKTNGTCILTFEDEGYAPIDIDLDWVIKRQAQAGGYYVVYDDGYTSWSPAEAFESGYTKL